MKTSKSNVLSFKNQVFYIGLDVHKDKIIAQVRSRGINIKKWRLSGGIKGAEELKDRLEKNYPGGIYQSVYEAGFHGFSIARRLEELGISCMVVNPADIPTKQKEKEKKNEILKLLLTIPGIGFISAATFICEIIDINRFSNFDKFACYIGLIPRTYSSGDKDINRGKSKRGNKWLSKFVIENTWVAIQKDPVLFKKYSDCVFGNKKKQIAIIKTAKKLMRT